VDAGHRVIVPSTPGYCDTEAPLPYEYYTLKRIASDLVAILDTLGLPRAIFIGHDWGSMIVQRVALWYPERVLAIGLVCVPFAKPFRTYFPLEKLVQMYPNFAYQLWFAGPDAERELSTPENIEKFLKGIFRVTGDKGGKWNVGTDLLKKMGDPSLGKLWENETVWSYYLKSFVGHGSLAGPLTYYKTRELNHRDELELVQRGAKIECPAMFVGATHDQALPPKTWDSQGWVPQLETHVIDKTHWCLVEDEGKEVTPIIQKWVGEVSQMRANL
jgi:soluble epoxide hydrolase / lipid-phosphate phosphatase